MSHDITDTVRDTLEQRARGLDVRTPSWQELETSFGRVRRLRRRRRAGRAGGAVAALALVAGGVQVGVLPYPAWAPAITMAASPSALDTGVVRGSLASDAAWLASLREVVARRSLTERGDGTWRVPSPDDVHVLYASDVSGGRLALVEMRMRAGLLESRQQVWYTGPRGAAADRLEEHSSGPPENHAVFWVDDPKPFDDMGTLVAVAAAQRAYLLAAQPPVYGADGKVRREVVEVSTGADGVVEYRVATTKQATVMISSGGSPRAWEPLRDSEDEAGTGPGLPTRAVDGRALPPLRDHQLELAFMELTNPSGLHRAPRSVVWTGPVGQWSGLVIAVTAPSGARLVGVNLQAPVPDQKDTWHGRGVATVLPAGKPADIALAWEVTGPDDSGDAPPVRHIGVLGPVGATSARLVDGVTAHRDVALTDRAGLLPPPGAGATRAQVQFRDAKGRLMDTVDVLDLHAQLPTGLPQ